MRNIFLLRKTSAQGLWIACFGIVLVRCTDRFRRTGTPDAEEAFYLIGAEAMEKTRMVCYAVINERCISGLECQFRHHP
jgi:hypothetical protein